MTTVGNRPIIWIASYPKSGSTWLRMLLHAWFNGGQVHINEPGITTGDKNPYFWQTVAPKPLDRCAPLEFSHLRGAMLCHVLTLIDRRPLWMKTHHVFGDADDMPLIPPAMSRAAWYLVRDPRDVAVSCANHFRLEVDEVIERMGCETYQIADDDSPISHYLSSWRLHVRSWLSDAPRHFPVKLVRYERLLEAPGEVFSGLLRSVDIEPEPERVAACVAACRFERLQAQEAEAGFQEAPKDCGKFFNQGVAGAWRKILTEAQRQRIETEHQDAMKHSGYLDSGPSLSTATAAGSRTKTAPSTGSRSTGL